jgi:hypothetical protein
MASFGNGRGDYRQVGGNGEWAGTNAIIGLNGRIFASHSNGKVFNIDPHSGQWTQVGPSTSWKTRLMFALGDWLALVEQSGTMWALDPNTGNHQQVGKDGEWTNIMCGDWSGDSIFCFSRQGTLWDFSTQHGWRQLGTSANWKSKFVFAGNGLVTIEQDNTLFRVDERSGHATPLGRERYDVKAGVGMSGHVYACFSDGHLWDLDIATGGWSMIGNSNQWQSHFLLTTGDNLITLERSGTLFELSVDPAQVYAPTQGYVYTGSAATEGTYAGSSGSGITEAASEGASEAGGDDGTNSYDGSVRD